MAEAHKCTACGEVYGKDELQDTCPKCGNRQSNPHDILAEPEREVATYSAEEVVELEDENDRLRDRVAELEDESKKAQAGADQVTSLGEGPAALVIRGEFTPEQLEDFKQQWGSILSGKFERSGEGAAATGEAGAGDESKPPTGPSGPLPTDLGLAPDAAGGEPKPTE